MGNSKVFPKAHFAVAGILAALATNMLLSAGLDDQKYRETQVLALAKAETAAVSLLPTNPSPAEQQAVVAPAGQNKKTEPRQPAAAILSAPTIGLHVAVFDQGTSKAALRKGPAFFPGRSSPAGRVAIAGHLGESGGPFRRIGDLQLGDLIILSIPGGGDHVYRVAGSHMVYERDWSLINSLEPGLVLQACLIGRRAYRLLVEAKPYRKR